MKMCSLSRSILLAILLAGYCCKECTSQESGSIASARLMELAESTSILTQLFPTGAVVCPETKLDPPLKQNNIFIGLVGCDVDPLLPILEIEDTPIQRNGTNCFPDNTEICPLPGTVFSLGGGGGGCEGFEMHAYRARASDVTITKNGRGRLILCGKNRWKSMGSL